jgi:hypothetical protein
MDVDDIDRQIEETNRKIEKLSTLKMKQEELKRIGGSSGKSRKVYAFRSRRFITLFLVACMFAVELSFVFMNTASAADPTIVTATPENGSFFANANTGNGVDWAFNVSDADTDIQEVRLLSNDSGTWAIFYDSNALGGVAYHNTNGRNPNWTGNWVKYYWNISVDDGTWHNTTYSFTTGYQWGDPQMAVLDDGAGEYVGGSIVKNSTGDYYLMTVNHTSTHLMSKTSDTGTNWSLRPLVYQDATDVSWHFYNGFIYNNQPYFIYLVSSALYWITYNGASWSYGSTGITTNNYYGADCIYYNGKWNLLVTTDGGLYHYTGAFPNSWSYVATVANVGGGGTALCPSLAVLDGILYCVQKDAGSGNLNLRTYNGISWTDRGNIGGDANILGDAFTYRQQSIEKDPVNQQIVLVYVNVTYDLVYRVTNNLTGWSSPQPIISGDYGSAYMRIPTLSYMDRRLVILVGYNARGGFNLYTISSPDYSGRASGFNTSLNRIQWPDANPDDTYVNSTVFALKNIDNRSIKNITWHFEDLGEITKVSNYVVWTNMSGVWNNIGICDANGDVAMLDISGEMAGGLEWVKGQTTYWKICILDVGGVSEDVHTTDEDIYYRVDF